MAYPREELYRKLDLRLDDPSIGEAQDAEIWRELGVDRALLVLDLSGFTRITQRRGILHFLAVYRRAMHLVLPAIDRAGGRVVKREADNVIASFGGVVEAVRAAREIVSESARLDAALGEDDRVYPCLGIGFGRILELTDDVFGDQVNLAFKLGEDVARRREILLTDAAARALQAGGAAPDAERASITLGGVDVPYFKLLDAP
jgi:class 3 adenylate cyclase